MAVLVDTSVLGRLANRADAAYGVTPMAGATDDGRAGVGRRLVAVAMGCVVAGLGAAAPWLTPDACRWAGWPCLVLFVPAGCGTAFVGARGRAADLRELSAQAFAGELVGGAIAAAVVGLLAALL